MSNSYSRKVTKKCRKDMSLYQPEEKVLTQVEREVLYLFREEYLTPKQIALRRKCSLRQIQRILKSIKEKGVNVAMHVAPPVTSSTGDTIRVHAQRFRIKIIFKDDRYRKQLDSCNLIYVDGNTIQLFRDSIQVISGHSFWGSSAENAVLQSLPYWQRLFIRLENDLHVILVKHRHQNIKQVYCHVAKTGDSVAKYCDQVPIRVFDSQGELRLLIDNSFNLHELETVHPEKSREDMDGIVRPFLNDMIEKEHLHLSELTTMILYTQKQIQLVVGLVHSNTQSIGACVSLIQSMLPKPKENNNNVEEKPGYVV